MASAGRRRRPRGFAAASLRPLGSATPSCALGAVALIALRPGLLPGVSDIFFLEHPVPEAWPR